MSQDRYRFNRNPPRKAVPRNMDDLYFDAEGRLIHETYGNETREIGAATTLTSVLTLLGVSSYANLAAANLALTVGKIYYDTSLGTLNVTTA